MNKITDKSIYKSRIVDKLVEKDLRIFGAICIEGPKWCGKTWTSFHHAKSEFFVGDPSGNFSNRMLAEVEPYTVLKGETPRLIDEWQEVPALWDATRAFVDKNGNKGQIILTGSSTPVNKGVLHSGTGRIKSIRMNTLSKYLDAFNRMFLFNNQEPFSPNIRSSLRVKQMEKRHFSDPAMACAMLKLNPKKMMNDLKTFGFMFEAMVERDLSIYAQLLSAKLFHYQDYKSNEIDAVIELEDGNWCAIEIKLGLNKVEEGSKNLIKVCKDLVDKGGKEPIMKCVIYGVGNIAYKNADGVYIIPITALKP